MAEFVFWTIQSGIKSCFGSQTFHQFDGITLVYLLFAFGEFNTTHHGQVVMPLLMPELNVLEKQIAVGTMAVMDYVDVISHLDAVACSENLHANV